MSYPDGRIPSRAVGIPCRSKFRRDRSGFCEPSGNGDTFIRPFGRGRARQRKTAAKLQPSSSSLAMAGTSEQTHRSDESTTARSRGANRGPSRQLIETPLPDEASFEAIAAARGRLSSQGHPGQSEGCARHSQAGHRCLERLRSAGPFSRGASRS